MSEFEKHIADERIRQLPKKCLSCECVFKDFTDDGNVIFGCELEACYLDEVETK